MEPDDRISGEAAKKTNQAIGEGTSSMRESEERVEVKNGDWSLLPDVILNTVSTYLRRADQVSASQVCHNWSRAMDNPNQWRKIDMDLYVATLESLQRKLRFIKWYGHHLHCLTIRYHRTCLRANPDLERPLITLIDDIHGRAQLRYFKLQNFELKRGKRKSSILGHKFRNSVCRFLKKQKNLSEVVMTRHYATINQGNHMLKAIAKGSGATLQTLALVNFFHPKYAVFSNATYLSILANFKHLEVASFDYYCVSEEVLLCLAHNCAERLRSLVIRCQYMYHEDVTFQAIGNDTWKQFKRECPKVLVDFQIWDIRDLETLKRLVPCQVPLRSLNYIMTYFSEVKGNLDAINFIIHVLTHCENTLEDLDLYLDDTVPNVGTLVEEFLPSLKNLKRLSVTADIPYAFVERVNALRAQKLIHLSEFRANNVRNDFRDNLAYYPRMEIDNMFTCKISDICWGSL